MNGIYFPGLGIYLKNVLSGINIGSFELKFYGIIIAVGFILAYTIATKEAKKTGQNDEDYLDFLLTMVIPVILGARLYYIIFNPSDFFEKGKSFGQVLFSMINLRNGGLAIYGGLIVGAIVGFLFCKKRKIYLPLFADNICMGVLVGQILGRWGNFFNREVFGDYTSSVFRMAIPVEYYSKLFMGYLTSNGIVTQKMLDNQEVVNGVSCITVHPTFIYESLWNVAILLLIFFYRKHKKFDGEMAMLYVLGYGIGRFIVEAIRTDSLMMGPLKASQVVAVACVIVALVVIIKNRIDIKNGKTPVLHVVGKCEPYQKPVEESGEN